MRFLLSFLVVGLLCGAIQARNTKLTNFDDVLAALEDGHQLRLATYTGLCEFSDTAGQLTSGYHVTPVSYWTLEAGQIVILTPVDLSPDGYWGYTTATLSRDGDNDDKVVAVTEFFDPTTAEVVQTLTFECTIGTKDTNGATFYQPENVQNEETIDSLEDLQAALIAGRPVTVSSDVSTCRNFPSSSAAEKFGDWLLDARLFTTDGDNVLDLFSDFVAPYESKLTIFLQHIYFSDTDEETAYIFWRGYDLVSGEEVLGYQDAIECTIGENIVFHTKRGNQQPTKHETYDAITEELLKGSELAAHIDTSNCTLLGGDIEFDFLDMEILFDWQINEDFTTFGFYEGDFDEENNLFWTVEEVSLRPDETAIFHFAPLLENANSSVWNCSIGDDVWLTTIDDKKKQITSLEEAAESITGGDYLTEILNLSECDLDAPVGITIGGFVRDPWVVTDEEGNPTVLYTILQATALNLENEVVDQVASVILGADNIANVTINSYVAGTNTEIEGRLVTGTCELDTGSGGGYMLYLSTV